MDADCWRREGSMKASVAMAMVGVKGEDDVVNAEI